MLEKIEGIVIRTRDYGETHKIITLFTREKGKIGVMARGAKKPKSRMASVTQPFIHGQFLIQIGSGLGSLSQGEMVTSLRSIREDIIKTAYASYLAELTDKLVDEKKPDPFLYEQLLQTFVWMAEGKDCEILSMMYELKMYRKAGFAPKVDACLNCGAADGPFSFSVVEGGFLCFRCKQMDPQAYGLTEPLAKLLRLFLHMDVKRLGQVSMKDENKKKLRMLMDEYYERYGGYFLKSKKFLKQIDLFTDNN
ncbi:DNA repair protein RecO [Halobacillus andaensis]|uniref:DNA repair protein RecO n=1 Tax=Halobacillus andaensis TaxID=1176239 RepID=A0A917ESC2_HALAA|nr:DNA repair protein RecO [Halobacillus andaensis]MBP2003057.1 DNA repair protein RecO (recombination protein O) [Halobacillus andaensis]GGF07704.1 DNA repair protein RecO [Halobacillus andaensis]